jgi:succinyl-CoA synthetase beta subunit
LKLFEFQAKNILEAYGVCIPRGKVISQGDDVAKIFQEIGCNRCVIKAQILAGGRGKSGGVQFANSPEEAKVYVAGLLGSHLVTHQTGQRGTEIKYVLIEEALSIKRELYLAITIDRCLQSPVLIVSAEGGMEIEEVAKKTPGKIIKEPIDVFFGIHSFQVRRIASQLNISGTLATKLHALIVNLFDAFMEKDCSLLEINPLAVTVHDELCALDAKMDIDDNALYRHPEFNQFIPCQDISPAEALAREYRLSYIGLEGNIGCLVNGAGLAMATMDIIKLYGGEPANFLDVGGDASPEQVTQAFKIILSDPKVKAVLINIFGGIMKCDVIASGIIQAIHEIGIHIPLVIRLEGTNVEIAKKILEASGLKITSASDMKEAANLVVSKVR